MDRRGTLAAEAVVACRCILIAVVVEDCREWDEEGTREWPALGCVTGEEDGVRNGGVGRVDDEMVRECW